jgi:hypothetical protein
MCLQPSVQGIDIGKAGHWLPQPPPRILHVLLTLSVMPCGHGLRLSHPDAGLQKSASNRRSQIYADCVNLSAWLAMAAKRALTCLPPRMACGSRRSPGSPALPYSSLQSNWKASPAANTKGTKVPRPLVYCSRWRSAFQARTKPVLSACLVRQSKGLQPARRRRHSPIPQDQRASALRCLRVSLCPRHKSMLDLLARLANLNPQPPRPLLSKRIKLARPNRSPEYRF